EDSQLPTMLTLPESLFALALPHASSPFNVVTASLGVITVPYQQPPVSTSYLMQQADTLLYQAKNQGRNQAIQKNLPEASEKNLPA
ncbi:MAG TPA: diguanylate cyclase, partial [Rheinheimera sp.]|nr:diguanylate cyclase [Rheinheimera sp.]